MYLSKKTLKNNANLARKFTKYLIFNILKNKRKKRELKSQRKQNLYITR